MTEAWKFCIECGRPFKMDELIKLERSLLYLCVSCAEKLKKNFSKMEKGKRKQIIKYLTKKTDMTKKFLKSLKTDDLEGVYRIIKTAIEQVKK